MKNWIEKPVETELRKYLTGTGSESRPAFSLQASSRRWFIIFSSIFRGFNIGI